MSKTTIPVNTTTSGVIDTAGNTAQMLYTPSNMTGTAFTFLVGDTATNVTSPLEDGFKNLVSVAFDAGAAVPLDTGIFASVRFFKIVSNATETGGDKVIGVSYIQG